MKNNIQIDEECKQFYAAIKPKFDRILKSTRNESKILNLFLVLTLGGLTGLILSVFVLPYAYPDIAPGLKKIIPFLFLSLIFFGLLQMLYLIYQLSFIESLKEKQFHQILAFCYLLATSFEINKFNSSGMKEYQKNGKLYFEEYLRLSDLQFKVTVPEIVGETSVDVTKNLDLIKLINQLEKEKFWFKIDEESSRIIKILSFYYNKIIHRVNNGVEIGNTTIFFSKLLKYEFSKIHNQSTINAKSINIDDETKELFLSVVEELKNTPISNHVKLKSDSYDVIIKSTIGNSNLIVKFVSWYFIIFIFFSGTLLLLKEYFDLSMDSKFLVSMISIPLASAIAIIFGTRRTNANNT